MRARMHCRRAVGALMVLGAGVASLGAPVAEGSNMAVVLAQKTGARPASTPLADYAAGQSIVVRASRLVTPAKPLCVGLSSLIDHYSLPINLGQLHVTSTRVAELRTRIPAGLIGPEPAGPYVVFVGVCGVPAPTGEYARAVITIHK